MKDDSIYLEHIEQNLKRIILYTSGKTKEEFLDNIQLQDACIRQIEIMGEAINGFPKPSKETIRKCPGKT